MHYLCLSSCKPRLFSSFTVAVCVSRKLETSVIMYGIHCKMTFNALMQKPTTQSELGRFMHRQLHLQTDICTIPAFQQAFRLPWPSQNGESVESGYLNSSNLILPFFKKNSDPFFCLPFQGENQVNCFFNKSAFRLLEYNFRKLAGVFL